MNEFKITKGLKVPTEPKSRNCKYPWHQLEVGDSFLIPSDKQRVVQQNIKVSARMAGLRHDKQFTVRIVNAGVRVWRTA